MYGKPHCCLHSAEYIKHQLVTKLFNDNLNKIINCFSRERRGFAVYIRKLSNIFSIHFLVLLPFDAMCFALKTSSELCLIHIFHINNNNNSRKGELEKLKCEMLCKAFKGFIRKKCQVFLSCKTKRWTWNNARLKNTSVELFSWAALLHKRKSYVV